jgi:hypothetical protein
MIWEYIVPRAELNETYAGDDVSSPPHPQDSCFKYDLNLPESAWFNQAPGENIYWLSIAAIYSGNPIIPVGADPPGTFTWGWKTRPYFDNDEGIIINQPTVPILGMPFITGEPISTKYTYLEPWDLAFELTTFPMPTPTPTPTPTPIGEAPQLTILTPSGDMELTTDTYTITWTDEDPDSDALISLFYDTDNTGADGDAITTGVSENSEIDMFEWNLAGISEGIYWIYGVIDDGNNAPVISYSPGSLMVSRITVEELKNHLLGIEAIPIERFIFADFNRDGAIDVADLIFLLNWNKK